MGIFVSKDGNREVWDEKPVGYYTTEEWDEMNPKPPEITPTLSELAQSVSMTKAEFLLLVTNLTPITLGQIEEYVNSNDDIKIRFTYANIVERNHPMLDSASSVFGVTPELLDIMFVNKDELIRKIDAGEPIEGIS